MPVVVTAQHIRFQKSALGNDLMEEDLLVLGQGVENDGRQLVGLSLPWSFWWHTNVIILQIKLSGDLVYRTARGHFAHQNLLVLVKRLDKHVQHVHHLGLIKTGIPW